MAVRQEVNNFESSDSESLMHTSLMEISTLVPEKIFEKEFYE